MRRGEEKTLIDSSSMLAIESELLNNIDIENSAVNEFVTRKETQ